MLLLAGLVLIALGIVSGAGLLLSAIAWLTVSHPATLWILFPLASTLGLLLAALGSRTRTVPMLLKMIGVAMFVLSLSAVAILLLGSIGFLPSPTEMFALWYVFGVGLVVGTAGFLIPASPGEPA